MTTYSRLMRDQARKHDSHLWRYNNDVTGERKFPIISPRENDYKLLHSCVMLSCNIGNYLIKRQSKMYIVISVIHCWIIKPALMLNSIYSVSLDCSPVSFTFDELYRAPGIRHMIPVYIKDLVKWSFSTSS